MFELRRGTYCKTEDFVRDVLNSYNVRERRKGTTNSNVHNLKVK